MSKKILLFVLLMSLCTSAFSAVVYNEWRGTSSTDWNIGTNWAAGYVPQIVAANGDNIRGGFKGSSYSWPIITSSTLPTPEAYNISLGGTTGGTLNITGGALNVGQYLFMGVSVNENGTLNISGGTITTGTFTPSNAHFMIGQAGIGTVNMTGGTISLTSNGATGQLRIAYAAGSSGKLNLNGGTIYAASLTMPYAANGALDIGGGTLILDGDATATVNPLVTSKKIVAYGDTGAVQVDYNIRNAGKTTVTGFLANYKATNPTPANGTGGLAISGTTMSWTAGTNAVSHNVYFGSTSPGTLQGNQTATTFNSGMLEYGKTYYWRIDEVNSVDGVTTGDVWNFTTVSGQATTPSPANAAINVSANTTLSWASAPGASSYNVYFGTTSPGASQGNQTATTFNPGALQPNTTYYWRIDSVNGSNVVTGNVWSFTTAQAKATNPTPANAAANLALTTTLSWGAGATAVSHDVYFGTVSPGTLKGNQAGTTYNPGTLLPNTTYYWRIDEKDASDNITTGDVWSFTTGNPSPIYPYLTWKNSPTNSIVVSWWNPDATGDSAVDYGTTISYGSSATDATVVAYHHVSITGLTPNTTYHYRIRSNDGTIGSDNTFTTADVNQTSFSFAVYGDPRGVQPPTDSTIYHTRHKQLCDWMATQNISFALETGDIVWAGGLTDGNCLGFYKEYFKAEQNLSKTKPIMTTPGNHELQPNGLGDSGYPYFSIYNTSTYPNNGPVGVNGRCYSFDYGNAHFISISSFQVSMATEATWLDADLAAARANPNIKWIFVWMHEPLYTNSGHPGSANELTYWGPLFDKYNVDIVFAGHNHVYERYHSIKAGQVVPDGEGPTYVTNGIGGAEFNTSTSDPKQVCWFGTTNLNKTAATIVTINGSILNVQTIPNLTGVPIDTFQLAKTIEGDFNQDGNVDAKDLKMLSDDWLGTGIWP